MLSLHLASPTFYAELALTFMSSQHFMLNLHFASLTFMLSLHFFPIPTFMLSLLFISLPLLILFITYLLTINTYLLTPTC